MTAWKDLERRVCRALGAERRPSVGAAGWAQGSDDDGTAPFSVETKRTTRYQLRRAWIEQARRHGRGSQRPWLLVIAEHRDRDPIVVLDFWAFVQLAHEAGRLAVLEGCTRVEASTRVCEHGTKGCVIYHDLPEVAGIPGQLSLADD